jgi:adenylate cyclase
VSPDPGAAVPAEGDRRGVSRVGRDALNRGDATWADVPSPSRRLAAIMFTDMVDYTALAQEDEARALAVLERHQRVLRPLFARYRGREVKTVGDAFLVEFESALEAVQCALEIQRKLHEDAVSAPEAGRVRVRIGIHVGDVVEQDGDVLGDAVNVASRIQPLAEPGGICLTQQVFDQVANKVSTPLVRLAPVPLKNLRQPVTVYAVAAAGTRPPPASVAPTAPGRQLAVLPLANISPDPNDAYFADGLTEELISVLSQVQGLSVIARTSVTPYKTQPKSIAEVGTDLGVDTVLEGSVRKAGKRVRVTLQLIDVPTQRHIWAGRYDREVEDIFAVQADVAERTAETLRLQLERSDLPGGRRRPTPNPAAYDLYLRGLVAWREGVDRSRSGVDTGMDEAVRCFDEATQLDPTFAEAFAAWGNLYVVAAGDSRSMSQVMPRARELAARALELDPQSSEAHATLANLTFQFDHDWGLAEAEFRKAIELNPSNALAHQFYGLMLFALGRFDEAKEALRRTIALDPRGQHRGMLAWIELEAGNFDAALGYARAQRDENPGVVMNHVIVGMFALAAGRRAEALREAETPLAGVSDEERFDMALLNALVGRPEAARAVIAEVEAGKAASYTSRTDLSMLYAALGERSHALDLLEKDYRDGERVLWMFHRGVYFDPIRDDPRFVAQLRRYGLPVGPMNRPTLRSTDP